MKSYTGKTCFSVFILGSGGPIILGTMILNLLNYAEILFGFHIFMGQVIPRDLATKHVIVLTHIIQKY